MQYVISLIVATKNRAKYLSRLLQSLVDQECRYLFEVVVVDNGSFDSTKSVVDSFSNLLHLEYLREDRAGKGIALNYGLQFVKGNLLVFTDDDVVPAKNWLEELYQAAESYPSYIIFGGRIEVERHKLPKWLLNSYNLMGLLTSEHNKGDKFKAYGYAEYPFGPNMAVRKDMLVKFACKYPENIGPGNKISVGDESAFLMQISEPSEKNRMYVPTAVVFHEVEKENISLFGAIKRCYFAGLSHARLGMMYSVECEVHGMPIYKIISQRFSTCRSVNELICKSVQCMGALIGKRNY